MIPAMILHVRSSSHILVYIYAHQWAYGQNTPVQPAYELRMFIAGYNKLPCFYIEYYMLSAQVLIV